MDLSSALLHIGFELQMVKWIMYCVIVVSFVVLINVFGSSFFKAVQGLRQGCPLSLYHFLLVFDGLSWAIAEAEQVKSFQRI